MVVVLGPSFGDSPELAAVEQLLAARREVGAIMVTNELTTDMLQRAAAGGRQGRARGPGRDDPAGRGRRPGGRHGLVMAAPVTAGPPTVEADGELGRVITVFSTKGGAGKSVIATNLAVVLAGRAEQPGGARRRRPPVR